MSSDPWVPEGEEDEYVWVRRVPIIDEAMIERAAKELIVIWNQDGCQPIDLWGKDFAPRAERVLRAALEVSDE